ncbi:MAG TPA: ATPase, T2SS/T4P/T4SS family [Patescibacteria group bacterium]|nr:ATPase, T2SS/T4P/T4SS family [Patescibacteria group bacterium]
MNISEQLAIQKMLSSIDMYRASVLHLSVGNPPMMRIGEKLLPVPEQNILTPDVMKNIVNAWLDEKDHARLEQEKEIIIAKTFENKKRFKISIFYQQGFLSASLLLIPSIAPALNELGLPPVAQRLVQTPSGLVLVIGPSGSRRSTTVASFIEYLNQNEQKHIMTIEEPVEILFGDNRSVIEQREVGKDVNTVEEGLAFAAHEDIDVVMISRLSSAKELHHTLALANSGKLVFAILSANSIVSALHSIIYSFEGIDQAQVRSDLATSLAAIINQRCLTTVGGDTTIIAEVMIPNETVRTIMQKGNIVQIDTALLSSHGEDGTTQSLDTQLQQAVANGYINREEAIRSAVNPYLFH